MIFNLCTLYLHFSVFRHRIAINVTVLRCYGVTLLRMLRMRAGKKIDISPPINCAKNILLCAENNNTLLFLCFSCQFNRKYVHLQMKTICYRKRNNLTNILSKIYRNASHHCGNPTLHCPRKACGLSQGSPQPQIDAYGRTL